MLLDDVEVIVVRFQDLQTVLTDICIRRDAEEGRIKYEQNFDQANNDDHGF